MPDIFNSAPKKTETQKEEKPKVVLHPKDLEANIDHHHNPFSSYCYLPHGINFENKADKEVVILFLRKHLITNIGWILLLTLMILAPSILSVFPILDFLPANFQFIAVLGWYLLTIAFALESFLSWFFNVNLVTNQRVVDIDFFNLIYKEVSDAELSKIEDVTYKMGGVVRTVFNYGDVLIQTAAEIEDIEFLAVPNPDRVAKILREMINKSEDKK